MDRPILIQTPPGIVPNGFDLTIASAAFNPATTALRFLAYFSCAAVVYGDWPVQPDPSFNAPTTESGAVLSVAPLPNGKVLVAGWSLKLNETPATGIVRLNSDGSIDSTFTPPLFDNPAVRTVLPLADGTCLIGGSFQARGAATARTGLAKLGTNGVLDVRFLNLSQFGGEILTIAVDTSGRILVGGSFVLNRSRSKANILRLLPDGKVDETLNPNASNEAARPTVNGTIQKIIPLSDGRILIGGGFTSIGGVDRNGVAILQPDGAADPSFNFDLEHDCCIQDIMLGEDGQVLVAGQFINFGGLGLAGLVRLTPDGRLDPSFQSLPGPLAGVRSLTRSGHEYLWVSGSIQTGGTTNVFGLVRLFSDGQVDTSFRKPLSPQTNSEFVVPANERHLFHLESTAEWIGGPLTYRLHKLITDLPLETPPQLLTEPKNIVAREGSTIFLAVDERASPRPTYQWRHNGLEIPDATNRFIKITNVRTAGTGDYQVFIQNPVGALTSKPIHVDVHPGVIGPGHLDLEFDPRTGVFGGIGTAQKLRDGKLLVVGGFNRIEGVSRMRLARLNSDGSVDISFVPQTSEYVYITSALPSINNTVVVLGMVNNAANTAQRSKVIRLNVEGSFDSSFSPFLSPENNPFQGMHVDAAGFVYVSGTLNGSTFGLFRWLPDGNRDTSYRLDTESPPSLMIGLPDGKVAVAGYFNIIAGQERNRLARLNSDGTLDSGFVPEAIFTDTSPERMISQPDGKILVIDTIYTGWGWGGSGSAYPQMRWSRFNSDGSLDLSFFPEVDARQQIQALEVQPTGEFILASTPFEFLDAGPPPFVLTRLYTDGSLDYGFYGKTEANGWISMITSLADSRLLVAGGFTEFAGVPRNGIARLYAHASTPTAPAIVRAPLGQRLAEGADMILEPSVQAAPRATYQWQKDNVNLTGQTDRVLDLRNLNSSDSGVYRLTAQNDFGSAASAVARVQVDPAEMLPGTADISFYSGTGPNGGVNQGIQLPDGKLLIAGNFTAVNHSPRPRLARLNGDGSLDEQFNPPSGPNAEITCMLVLPDGQIIIGGPFERIGPTNRTRIAALKANGVLNPTNRIAADARITDLLLTPEGKILGCGEGVLQRWHPTGSRDSSFNSFHFDGIALDMDLQPDGKIIIAGSFSADGVSRQNIARLNANGSVDTSFNVESGPNDRIDALALQSDGKILVAGAFTTFNDVPCGRIARLKSDGTLDTLFFVPTGAEGGRIVPIGHFGLRDVTAIHSLLVEPNGHILIAGEFTRYENVPAGSIARLYPDGVMDQSFLAGTGFAAPQTQFWNWFSEYSMFASRWVTRLLPMENQRVFAMGTFPSVSGVARSQIVKLVSGDIAPAAPVVKSQSVEFNARTGTNLLLHARVVSSPRSTFQWLHNGQSIPGATGAALSLTNITRAVGGEYTCLVSNSLGSVQFFAAKIGVTPPRIEPGAVDPKFNAVVPPVAQISSATLEGDGKILLVGSLQQFNRPWQPWLARLSSDGTTEMVLNTRNLNVQGGNISRAVTLGDGHILVNGSLDLQRDNGEVINVNWLRIKPDGGVDLSFTPPKNLGFSQTLTRLSNGKIVGVADGGTGPRLFQFNPDGTLDNTFTNTFDNPPQQIIEDRQGRLWVGGDFTRIGSVKRERIARLKADGSVDVTFDPSQVPDAGVMAMASQPDGSLVVIGWFSVVGRTMKPRLARFDHDGRLDSAFPESKLFLENSNLSGLALDLEGRILLAGWFQISAVTGQTAFQVIRLTPSGALDPSFNIGSGFEMARQGRGYGPLSLIGLTPTGKILVAGSFDKADGLPRRNVVRLLSDSYPRLAVQNNVQDRRWALHWDEGVLEESQDLFGPWTPTSNAQPPWSLQPLDDQKFFRLRMEE